MVKPARVDPKVLFPLALSSVEKLYTSGINPNELILFFEFMDYLIKSSTRMQIREENGKILDSFKYPRSIASQTRIHESELMLDKRYEFDYDLFSTIMSAVADSYDIKPDDILSFDRGVYKEAKRLLTYLLQEYGFKSIEISKILNKDPSTICRDLSFVRRQKEDSLMKKRANLIRQLINEKKRV